MNRNLIRITSIVVVLSLILCSFAACNKAKTEYEKVSDVEINTEKPVVEDVYELPDNANPLTGKLNLAESAKDKRPIAIMVANTPEARPQWGLATPDLMIEGLVAEETMGMMWVYADYTKIPIQVGPIAAANGSFADLAEDMNAIYVHWDGETKGTLNNIDGSKYQSSYFFWDNTRNPDNYEYQRATSGDRIQKAITQIGYPTKLETRDFAPYRVAVEGGTILHAGTDLTGPCTYASFKFTETVTYRFQYNKNESAYYQHLNGEQVVDASGKPIAYTNIIYLYVNVKFENGKAVLDFGEPDVVNEAGAYISKGLGQQIYWKFDSKTQKLQICDFTQTRILKVNPGNVWIGIVPMSMRSQVEKG